MDVIEEIRQRVQSFPQIKCEIENNRATVFPRDEKGFLVSLTENGSIYSVYFEGWHAEYDNAELALNVFAFGLSEDCRLEVGYRGRFPHVWTVEERGEDNGWFACDWIGCSEVGLLMLPLFWLPKRVLYLQNHWIPNENGNA